MPMSNIVYLITSYLNTYKNSLFSKVNTATINTGGLEYIAINFCFNGYDVNILVYNDTFIKIKVDTDHYTICDGIHSVRSEIDRLYNYRF